MSNDPENGKVVESVSMAELLQRKAAHRPAPAIFRALRRCWLSCVFAVFFAAVIGAALQRIKQPWEFFKSALSKAVESGKMSVPSMFLLFSATVIVAAVIRFVYCLADEMKKKG